MSVSSWGVTVASSWAENWSTGLVILDWGCEVAGFSCINGGFFEDWVEVMLSKVVSECVVVEHCSSEWGC